VLDDAHAGVVPNIHAKSEVGLGFHGQVRLDSSWPAAIYSPMLCMRPRPNGFITLGGHRRAHELTPRWRAFAESWRRE
jgi:hypothetical protein